MLLKLTFKICRKNWTGEALNRVDRALVFAKFEEAQAVQYFYEITDLRTGQPLAQSDDLSHPYYWAPFILIGNGL